MPIGRLNLIICFSLLLAIGEPAYAQDSPYPELRKGFQDPPRPARPKVYWWWLNGYADTVRLKAELRAMKEAGIGGADIFEIGTTAYSNPDSIVPAGPAFMSDASLETISWAIKEAGRVGVDVGLNLASSWNAGGAWTKPEHAAKSLYYSQTSVQGPEPRSINLPFPEISPTDADGKTRLIEFDDRGRPVYYEEVAIIAVPAGAKNLRDTSSVIELTRLFDPETGVLAWEVPDGEWDVYRYVCSNSGEQLKLPSPNSMAPIIDHYDSSATRAHFQYFIDRLQPLLGDLRISALKYFYLASYEATGSVWTSSLPRTFQELHGYSIHKFIPALFNENFLDAETARDFRQDYYRTLSELIATNHYGKAREICNEYGLKITSESGGPGEPLHNVPVDALKALGSLDIPRGEFWVNHHFYAQDSVDVLWLVKEVAAAAHIYQREIAEEEAFTSFQHWQEGPFDLKPLANRAFGEGMNRAVVHGFTHNPSGIGYPGIVYHAGTHYNDKRVWWDKVKPFNDYLARISYIGQQAEFHADVLYYYGERVPNFVAPKNTRFTAGDGYDYEIINTEVLLNELTVADGELQLSNGARFKLLSLGDQAIVSPEVVEKLAQLAEGGALILGPRPSESVGLSHEPEASRRVTDRAEELWSAYPDDRANLLGAGGIYSALSPVKALESLGVGPDFSYPDSGSGVMDFIHYRAGTTDFYLVSNTTEDWVSRVGQFRQPGKVPELWDPMTGKVVPISIYDATEGGVRLPLSLPAYGAYFIVFREGEPTRHFRSIGTTENIPPVQFREDGFFSWEDGSFALETADSTLQVKNQPRQRTIEGPWQVAFPADWGAPDSVVLPELISWTEADPVGIRYFSGTATYHNKFDYQPDEAGSYDRVYLDLGDLEEVGEVWLNEQPLGICWARPYAYDVTGLLSEGENRLKIEVANTWSNRISGDARTGETYTSTNISTAFRGTNWDQAPLLKSGLLGPVSLQFVNVITQP